MILRLTLSILVVSLAPSAWAQEDSALSLHLSDMLKSTLMDKIAGAEIRIPSLTKLCGQAPLSDYHSVTKARLVEDRPNGVALFEITGLGMDGIEKSDLIQTPYSAWRRVIMPTHRIYPNTKLKNEDFRTSEVNVATGSAREYRGVMVSAGIDFTGLQSKQTLLENQFVVTTAIEKQPDLHKGDLVRLDLISGDLTLSTQATASETGSVGDRIRVMTAKSKKEVVGVIREDHSVEVSL